MTKWKWGIFGIVFCILIAVFVFDIGGYQSPYYARVARRITAQTAQQLLEEKQLVCFGSGGGMIDQVNRVNMAFNYYQKVSLEEARELVVYALNTYLNNINSNEEVRPYLANYPFLVKDITIRIGIWKPGHKRPDPDNIYFISLRRGMIYYYLDVPDTYDRKLLHKETYEEALQKVGNLELKPAM